MLEYKYRIEVADVSIKNVALAIARVFNTKVKHKVIDTHDVYEIAITHDRDIEVGFSEYVKAENPEEQVFIQMPMMYLDVQEDFLLFKDVITALKAIGCQTNSTCAMYIKTPLLCDDAMLGCIFSEYIDIQYDQIQFFDVSPDIIKERSKLYKYRNKGIEFDNCNDIIDYINASYQKILDDDPLFAQNFSLNFFPYFTEKTIEFRAFNSVLDMQYILEATAWIEYFLYVCKMDYNTGWKLYYDFVREREKKH